MSFNGTKGIFTSELLRRLERSERRDSSEEEGGIALIRSRGLEVRGDDQKREEQYPELIDFVVERLLICEDFIWSEEHRGTRFCFYL